MVDWRPDRAVVEATLSRAGYLVLVDAFDPGWRASVDGAPAEVLRANLAFRAVALGAGTHRVELAYRPASVRIGLALSAAALAAAVLLGRVRARV